jgi:hypothetical protein
MSSVRTQPASPSWVRSMRQQDLAEAESDERGRPRAGSYSHLPAHCLVTFRDDIAESQFYNSDN